MLVQFIGICPKLEDNLCVCLTLFFNVNFKKKNWSKKNFKEKLRKNVFEPKENTHTKRI